jgi:ABC-2 type transport system ATP-binding protein
VRDLHAQGLTVRFSVDKPYLDEALRVLVGAGVRSLSTAPPTLEELFLRHYTGSPAAERMLR